MSQAVAATLRADLIVSGGTVVLPSGLRSNASVVVRGEQIAEIIDGSAPHPDASSLIDARGKLVLPGVVDAHVHVETPGPPNKPFGVYSDSFDSMTRAAAFGGVTTVIPFVFANGSADPAEYLDNVRADATKCAWTDFGFHFGIARDVDVEAIPQVVKQGVRSFKALMAYKHAGSMIGDQRLANAMERIAQQDGIMMVHAEDGELIDALEQRMKESGDRTPPAYARCRPIAAEHIAILRALELAKSADCTLYIVHLSTAAGLRAATMALEEGQRVVLETCPQYLCLTEEELRPERLGPFAKIGPPLRQRSDGDALWDAVRQGTIEILASDHAPRRREEKLAGSTDIFSAPFGGPGLETLLAVLFDESQRRDVTLPALMRSLCEMPARQFGMYPQKGVIAPGSDADLVVFDPLHAWTVTPEEFETNARYSVWAGRRVRGKVLTTIVRGKPIVRDGVACNAGGWGRFYADARHRN